LASTFHPRSIELLIPCTTFPRIFWSLALQFLLFNPPEEAYALTPVKQECEKRKQTNRTGNKKRVIIINPGMEKSKSHHCQKIKTGETCEQQV